MIYYLCPSVVPNSPQTLTDNHDKLDKDLSVDDGEMKWKFAASALPLENCRAGPKNYHTCSIIIIRLVLKLMH